LNYSKISSEILGSISTTFELFRNFLTKHRIDWDERYVWD